MIKPRRNTAVLLLLFVAAGFLAACQEPEPEGPPPAEPFENAALAIGSEGLGDSWALVSNEDQELVLSDGGDGVLTISMGEATSSPNIVEAVRGKLADFDAMEGGESFGNQQLQAPIGLVYTARGRYPGESGTTEEFWAYCVHPLGGRLLEMLYTYPAGDDSQTRAQNLINLFGYLEPRTGGEIGS